MSFNVTAFNHREWNGMALLTMEDLLTGFRKCNQRTGH